MASTRADVTVHIDELLDSGRTREVCDSLERTVGVLTVRCAESKPHLLVVEYNPREINSRQILDKVSGQGLHAELIGL